jgi:hypothetical protein
MEIRVIRGIRVPLTTEIRVIGGIRVPLTRKSA